MNICYGRLGDGTWMVEAYVFSEDGLRMYHATVFDADRQKASWAAVKMCAYQMGVLDSLDPS